VKGNVSLNEKLGSPDQKTKAKSLREAYESICLLEEIEKNSGRYSFLLQYKES
jgi:hypothetical protein